MSLLWTIKSLDQAVFDPIVAFIRPSSSLINLYSSQGIKTVEWTGIYTFEHTTASWCSLTAPVTWPTTFQSLIGWRRSQLQTKRLVEFLNPDLVHLNSVVLVPSASALSAMDIPFVWHVREATVHGYFGIRTRYLKRLLLTLPAEVIFISKFDKQTWVLNQRGVVIPNFVDFSSFNREIDGDNVRGRLGIERKSFVLLYLGGLTQIKGIFPLLEALSLVQAHRQDWVCVMPGSQYQPSDRITSRVARKTLSLFGSGTIAQRVQHKIEELGLENRLLPLPFIIDIAPYYAASDILLFPATRPHFARPVIEAAAMGKPAIGSNLGGVNELIVHGETGLLVEPASSRALADAILSLLNDRDKARALGENAYQMARERFDAQTNVRRIEQIYEAVLSKSRGNR